MLYRRLLKIKEWIDEHDPGSAIIPFSGAFELELMDMNDEEKEVYCKEQGMQRWVRLVLRGRAYRG